jgi:hypothetical protein
MNVILRAQDLIDEARHAISVKDFPRAERLLDQALALLVAAREGRS